MDIKVSVLTTAYNHAQYISQELDSILMQKTNFAFEIIVHDDASTDNTAEIIRKYANEFPDIIVPIFQTENQYSQGINPYNYIDPAIRGKYIAMCEGDDYWCDENKLQKQFDYMEAHPDCLLCFCNSYNVDVEGNILSCKEPVSESRTFTCEEVLSSEAGFCATAGIFYRAEEKIAANQAGIFKSDFGDYPLYCFLALRGSVYAFADKMVCYRCFVPGSWTMRIKMSDSPETYIHWQKAMLQLYLDIKALANGRYQDILDEKIRKTEFLIHVKKSDFKNMRKEKYREYYRHISVKDRAILFIKYYFPTGVKVFRFLRYGKKGLEKKY